MVVTTRVPHADWLRLRALADAKGLTLQHLGIEGLSNLLVQEGLPPIPPVY